MFSNRSVGSTGAAELVIRILDDTPNEDSSSVNSKVFFLSIPRKESLTIKNLKDRIAGKLSISSYRVTLLYCGELLNDVDNKGKAAHIPLEAFEPSLNPVAENNDTANGDYLIFRSRIWAHVSPSTGDENSLEGEDFESLDDLGAESITQFDEIQFLEPLSVEVSAIPKFILENELKLIDCSLHFSLLQDAGYSDIGAFASLTEQDLKFVIGRTLRGVIPRRSRLRILALSESIAKTLTAQDIDKSVTQSMMITKEMGKSISMEGDDTIYLKKADIKREWERKQKLAKNKKPEVITIIDDDLPSKTHSEELTEKINKIKWRCELDEDGIPKHILEVMKSSNKSQLLCCEKHHLNVEKTRQKLMETRKSANFLELQQIFNKGFLSLDTNGLLQKDTLKSLVKNKLLNYGYSYIHHYDEIIEELFKTNPVVMPLNQQIQSLIWIQDKETKSASMPTNYRYSKDLFINKFVELLFKIDKLHF